MAPPPDLPPRRTAHAAARPRRPRVRISDEAVPYRPTRGVFVTVDEVLDRGAIEPYLAWEEEHHRRTLAVPGVAGLWTFARHPSVAGRPPMALDARITVRYLDDDPVVVTERIAQLGADHRYDGDRPVTTRFAGPFETIVPWEWGWFD